MGHEGKYAGIGFAEDEKLREFLEWADMVFAMEEWMKEDLSKRFPMGYLKKQVVVLDVADVYQRGQPELVEILDRKIRGHVSGPAD